jgi:hypothetical protein
MHKADHSSFINLAAISRRCAAAVAKFSPALIQIGADLTHQSPMIGFTQ